MSDLHIPAVPKTNRMQLALKAVAMLVFGLLAMGLMLFLCAGTIDYLNAWLFLIAMLVNMCVVFIYLILRNPELLAKRLRSRERRSRQQLVIVLSSFMNIAAFIIPGFDYRFKWSSVPIALSFAALAIMEAGFILFYAAIFQNRFASRVIEIQDKQTVIDTGLYSIVRHPMYMAMLLIDLAIPLVLGSFIALVPMLFICLLLVIRILNEEELLLESLDGYVAYVERVRYRLIPFIW